MRAQGNTFLNSDPGLKGEWIILGLPFQLGTINGKAGVNLAPKHIREASQMGNYKKNGLICSITGDRIFGNRYLSDLGDFQYTPGLSLNFFYNRLKKTVANIAKLNKRIIFLGGDHGVTYFLIEGLLNFMSLFLTIQEISSFRGHLKLLISLRTF